MPDTDEQLRRGAKRIGRAWFVVLCVYLAGALFLIMAQVLIPAWGAVVVLGGTIATVAIDDRDGVLLAVLFIAQLAVGVAIVHGTAYSTSWVPRELRVPLFLVGVSGPFVAAVVAERRARRRARTTLEE